jgi:hypothetical protein
VNDRDEPVAVSPDVEHEVSVDVVGIPKNEPNFRKIVPSDTLDHHHPNLSVANAFGTSDTQEEQTETVPKSGLASNNVAFGSRPVNGGFREPPSQSEQLHLSGS